MRKKMYLAVLAAAAIGLCACGSSGKSASSATMSYKADANYEAAAYDDYGSYTENGYVEEYKSETESPMAQGETYNDSARKRIVTYSLDVETEAFDDLLAAINERVAAYGGYLESIDTYNGSNYSSRRNRHSSIVARIPAKNADSFVSFVGDSANITNKSLSSQDVTLTYVDTKSKKEAYQAEQTRLLALLEKAETIEDIITIESRLSDVRYYIESLESQLRTYDNLVDYSTVNMYIDEVKEYTEVEPERETFGQKISYAFTSGMADFVDWIQGIAIGFVRHLMGWIIFIIVVVATVFIIRHVTSKNRAKRIAMYSEMVKQRQDKLQNNAAAQNQAGNTGNNGNN